VPVITVVKTVPYTGILVFLNLGRGKGLWSCSMLEVPRILLVTGSLLFLTGVRGTILGLVQGLGGPGGYVWCALLLDQWLPFVRDPILGAFWGFGWFRAPIPRWGLNPQKVFPREMRSTLGALNRGGLLRVAPGVPTFLGRHPFFGVAYPMFVKNPAGFFSKRVLPCCSLHTIINLRGAKENVPHNTLLVNNRK